MRLGTIDPQNLVAETVKPKQMPPASEGFIGIKSNGSPEQFCHAWKCPDVSPDVPKKGSDASISSRIAHRISRRLSHKLQYPCIGWRLRDGGPSVCGEGLKDKEIRIVQRLMTRGSLTNMASIKLTLHTLLMSSEVYFEMHLTDYNCACNE